MLDLVIEDATVYDGTGSPWFRASVGLQGDRIAAVGTAGWPSARGSWTCTRTPRAHDAGPYDRGYRDDAAR